MSGFIVIAEVTAPRESAGQIANALNALAELTRKELGCVAYEVCRELVDEAHWLIYEVWRSEQAWRRHLETDHLLKFRAQVHEAKGRLSARQFKYLECT